MKKFFAGSAFFLIGLPGVFADDNPITAEARAEVNKVVESWGCSGGTMELEDSGVYEIDDAMCPGGEYDFYISADHTLGRYITLTIVRH